MVARHVISTLSVSQLESSHASIYESYLESHRSAAPTYAFQSLSELLPKPESSLDAQIESPSYCQSPNRSSNLPLRNWSLNNVTHRRNSLCIAQSAARETSIKHTNRILNRCPNRVMHQSDETLSTLSQTRIAQLRDS